GGTAGYWLSYINAADVFSASITFQMVVMALLGGLGTPFGPIVGAAFLTLVSEFLGTRFAYHYLIAIGVIIVLVSLFAPAGMTADAVCRLGIAKTFQIPQLFPRLTVAENVLVAALYGGGHGLSASWREAREWLAFVGLADKAEKPAETLTVSERRRADLARVLGTGASLILLDENMAGLNRKEVEAAVGLLRDVRARGRTLVVTEHIMRAIMGLADRVVVLNYGEKIAEGRPADVMRDAA